MKNTIILPSTNEEGKPRVSYSQINSWKSATSFEQPKNIDGKEMKLSGKAGYVLSKFLNYKFPDTPKQKFAPFGEKVEDAICKQVYKDFYKNEIEILKSIKPIGIFQKEFEIDFDDFVLTGFIDDSNKDASHLRDYKTCSKSSVKQYYEDDYWQLDIYAMDKWKKTGILPKHLEVVAIERLGNPFRNEELTVGDNVWYIDKETSEERLMYIESQIRNIVEEISNCYKIFLSMSNN